jgi:hypothetical protein
MSDNDRFDDELMARARDLSADVQPDRDLWPSIEAAITESARPATPLWDWRPMLAQAAAVILLVGGSSMLTYLAVKDDGSTLSPVSATNIQPLDAMSASFGERYSLGPDFQDARRDLEGRLELELDRLSPESRADVEASLKTIRAAIADINEALAEEPDNALLQELLMRSYREELAVMRQVNGITSAVMFREDI